MYHTEKLGAGVVKKHVIIITLLLIAATGITIDPEVSGVICVLVALQQNRWLQAPHKIATTIWYCPCGTIEPAVAKMFQTETRGQRRF